MPIIQAAEHSIEVLTYDWKWYPENPEHEIQQLNISMVAAVSRGVKVRAYVQDRQMVNFLKSHGIKARLAENQATLHAKMLIVDDKQVVIGSHNLTHRAMSYNIETSVLIDDPDIVAHHKTCLLYTSPSPRDRTRSRMPSSA